VRDFGDVVVAVGAGPHVVVFNKEATFRGVNLGPFRVLGWSPFRIGVALQAGFIVTEILGYHRAGKAQGRHGQDKCNVKQESCGYLHDFSSFRSNAIFDNICRNIGGLSQWGDDPGQHLQTAHVTARIDYIF
jgi:hypothetical protein